MIPHFVEADLLYWLLAIVGTIVGAVSAVVTARSERRSEQAQTEHVRDLYAFAVEHAAKLAELQRDVERLGERLDAAEKALAEYE